MQITLIKLLPKKKGGQENLVDTQFAFVLFPLSVFWLSVFYFVANVLVLFDLTSRNLLFLKNNLFLLSLNPYLYTTLQLSKDNQRLKCLALLRKATLYNFKKY